MLVVPAGVAVCVCVSVCVGGCVGVDVHGLQCVLGCVCPGLPALPGPYVISTQEPYPMAGIPIAGQSLALPSLA